MASHQTRVILRLSCADALARCVTALSQIKGCQLDYQNSRTGIVTGSVAMNWQTFGDEITLTVSAIEDTLTQVDVHSKTKLFQWYDYGRNVGHVRAIVQFLNQDQAILLRGSQAPDPAARELLRASQNTRQGDTEDARRQLLRPDPEISR